MSGTPSTAAPYRPLTVQELEDHANALELGADAARHAALEEYVRAGIAGRPGGDEGFRKAFAAQTAADLAAKQAESAKRTVEVYATTHDEARSAAAQARATGDHQAAGEHDEAAEIAIAKMRIWEHQQQEAERAVSVHRAESDRWLAQNTDEVLKGGTREYERQRLEDVFDAQERQANDYREGAKELREAERLEAALPDLEARGVAGVERVRDAIAEHRRLAAEAMDRGWSADDPPPTPVPPAPTSSPTPVGGEADEIEMPPMDMTRKDSEIEIEMPAADVSGDEPQIEMPDVSGDEPEIEMPPMDMTGDEPEIEMEG